MTEENPLAARAAELEAQAEKAPPEAWVPENPGDKLTGTLVRMEEGVTEYGVQDIAVIARYQDGQELAFWLLHAVARSEWEKVEPQPGELVCVHYTGRKKPASPEGKPYQHFRILVDRGGASSIPAPAREPGEPAPASSEEGEDEIPF